MKFTETTDNDYVRVQTPDRTFRGVLLERSYDHGWTYRVRDNAGNEVIVRPEREGFGIMFLETSPNPVSHTPS